MEIPDVKVQAEFSDKLNISKGRIFLVLEERTDFAMDIFKDLLMKRCEDCPCNDNCENCEYFGKSCVVAGEPCDKKMWRGMMLTRSHPAEVRRWHPLGEHPIYWLTTNVTSREMTLSPTTITKLHFAIENFFNEKSPGVILMDCLEYMITQNNYESILRLIQAWNDKIVDTKTLMLVSLDPLTLSLQQLHLLKREMFEIHAPEK
jgi:hypothetical protein